MEDFQVARTEGIAKTFESELSRTQSFAGFLRRCSTARVAMLDSVSACRQNRRFRCAAILLTNSINCDCSWRKITSNRCRSGWKSMSIAAASVGFVNCLSPCCFASFGSDLFFWLMVAVMEKNLGELVRVCASVWTSCLLNFTCVPLGSGALNWWLWDDISWKFA